MLQIEWCLSGEDHLLATVKELDSSAKKIIKQSGKFNEYLIACTNGRRIVRIFQDGNIPEAYHVLHNAETCSNLLGLCLYPNLFLCVSEYVPPTTLE